MKNEKAKYSKANWGTWVASSSLPSKTELHQEMPFQKMSGMPSGPQEMHAGSGVYDVLDFGAVGDGKTLNTDAFQSAINICHRNQGGIVLVPAGIFLIGSVELKANVTLYLCPQATLLGTADRSQYRSRYPIPSLNCNDLEVAVMPLLFAVGAHNICIEGGGRIEGLEVLPASTVASNETNRGDYMPPLPFQIVLFQCSRVAIKGVVFQNHTWHGIGTIQSEHIHLEDLSLEGGENKTHNGFHFIHCNQVHLHGCDLSFQLEACIIEGNVQNCTISGCNLSAYKAAFRFREGRVQNITISNCTINDTQGCFLIMDFSVTPNWENIMFSNLVIKNVGKLIYIGKMATGSASIPSTTSSTKKIRGISFHHIRVMAAQPVKVRKLNDHFPEAFIVLNGLEENPLTHISFQDVHIDFNEGYIEPLYGGMKKIAKLDLNSVDSAAAYGLWAKNVQVLTIYNIRFSPSLEDARMAMLLHQVQDAVIDGLSVPGHEKARAVLHLVNTKDIFISNPRVLKETPYFIEVEGAQSDNIKIDGGDLSKIKKRMRLHSNVIAKAVRGKG